MTRGLSTAVTVLACSVTLLLNACQIDSLAIPDLASGTDGTPDAVTGGTTGGSTTGGTMGGTMPPPEETIPGGDLTESQTWSSSITYRLDGVVFVPSNVTLTIEAGTTILGNNGSALIVQQGGTLIALGTRTSPIVFTSSQPVGSRAPGDWGGVALLGFAPINDIGDGNGNTAFLEGVGDDMRDKARYGGSQNEYTCGSLEYVRIEFAGFRLTANEELNGLMLGGCGFETSIRNIQVHRCSDDGVEVFGGSVVLKNILITNNEDDGLDWDRGWIGGGQFIAIYQDIMGADNGIEADNGDLFNSIPVDDAVPVSAPTLYNLTIVSNRAGMPGDTAATFKAGTGVRLRNAVMQGHSEHAINVETEISAQRALTFDAMGMVVNTPDPPLLVTDTVIWDHGPTENDNQKYFPTLTDEPPGSSDLDDDGGFDEDTYFRQSFFNIQFIDPQLNDVTTLSATSLVPSPTSPLNTIAGARPASIDDEILPLDTSATFLGAFRPGAPSWAEGWTAFPEN